MSRYAEVAEALRSKPRRWLVTGVAGFIGSQLLIAYHRRHHSGTAVARGIADVALERSA